MREFDGETYDPVLDRERLVTQLERVRSALLQHRGAWFSLSQLTKFAGGSEAGVSARIRDLRKAKNGGFQVERKRLQVNGGTWVYRIPR